MTLMLFTALQVPEPAPWLLADAAAFMLLAEAAANPAAAEAAAAADVMEID
jgi:hypothetical protein